MTIKASKLFPIGVAEEARRHGPSLLTAQLLEHRQRPFHPKPRKAAGDDQPRRQLRVPDCDPEADHPAKRLPKDDRPLDPEHIAERGHVVDPRIEGPTTRRAFVAAPLATMIEEDELRLILERAEKRLQRAVVESRTTMQTDHDRPLAHDRSVRDKLHPSNVEVEPNIAGADTHSTTLIRFGAEAHAPSRGEHRDLRECAGMSLERAVQTRSEASCSDSRSAIMIGGMWTNPEGTSDIRLMSDYVSTTRRSSYTGTGRLKPFISSCTAGCASTESSKAENARWLRRICPAAAASLSLAARLVTGPSTP